MNPHGALALEKSDRVRHAVLGWDAQAQMDMIGHRMAFQELDAALATQLPQDQADPASQPPVEDLPTVFRYNHRVGLALPPHMGQALPLVHGLLLPAPPGLPGRRSLCFFEGNARRIARSSLGHTARGRGFRRY